jgi:large subunit ribosomal protein L23
MSAIDIHDVLVRPLITEKNTMLMNLSKYCFEVNRVANKLQIKEAVQTLFSVEVSAVNVSTVPGRMRRVGKSRGMTSPWRKAVVTLKPGQRIEIFEGG